MPKNNNNLGDQYEVDVYKHCNKKGVIAPNTSRGGGGKGSDITLINTNKKHINIESKAKGADYGQKYVHYDLKLTKWVWDVPDTITKLYDTYNILGYIQNFVPLLHTKQKNDYTVKDKDKDSKNFTSNSPPKTNFKKIFFEYYALRNTFYTQIKNFGLYHLKQDFYQLGTVQFDGIISIRFRLKAMHAHSYWKDGEKLSSKEKFNKEKKKSPESKYEIKDTPWDSKFCVVMKRVETNIGNTLTKSKLSIDGKDSTQKFPIL